MTQKHEGPCRYCGNEIPKGRSRQAKYCSEKCYDAHCKDKWRAMNPEPKLPTSTVGVLSEYRVMIDLLTKGYEVFRATNPQCSCDLAILKNDMLLRVEVTTGRYAVTVTGKPFYASHDASKYDILALVFHDKIEYMPELPL